MASFVFFWPKIVCDFYFSDVEHIPNQTYKFKIQRVEVQSLIPSANQTMWLVTEAVDVYFSLVPLNLYGSHYMLNSIG